MIATHFQFSLLFEIG